MNSPPLSLLTRPASTSPAAPPARSLAPYGPLALTGLGVLVFLLVRLPVTDLNAADARAGAVRRGVGATYWFSWFGGTVPARYSVLTGVASSLIGVRLLAAVGVLSIAVLLPRLLIGSHRPVGATYLGVIAALSNLYSGRVAFCAGAALAVAAGLALRRQAPWPAGVLNLLAALVSGLPAVFLLLAVTGPVLTGQLRPTRIWPFLTLTAVGLTAPLLYFGAPGPLAFDGWTLTRVLVIVASALAVRPPAPVRWTLAVTLAGCLLLFVVPNSIGGNINRFACYLVPALLWAFCRQRRAVVVIAVLPALLYSAWMLGSDVHRGLQPSARPAYDAPLIAELASQPGMLNHRVEALDTSTHRPSADLAADYFLARGWESQSDAAANPIMYRGPLTATRYRHWLDNLAVGWVAVPDDVNPADASEARLITTHPGYLHQVWRRGHWSLYAVRRPMPLVPPPATLVSRSPAALTIAVPRPITVTLRIRPSRYLRAVGSPGAPGSITRLNATTVLVRLPSAGTYRISGAFQLSRAFQLSDVRTHLAAW